MFYKKYWRNINEPRHVDTPENWEKRMMLTVKSFWIGTQDPLGLSDDSIFCMFMVDLGYRLIIIVFHILATHMLCIYDGKQTINVRVKDTEDFSVGQYKSWTIDHIHYNSPTYIDLHPSTKILNVRNGPITAGDILFRHGLK